MSVPSFGFHSKEIEKSFNGSSRKRTWCDIGQNLLPFSIHSSNLDDVCLIISLASRCRKQPLIYSRTYQEGHNECHHAYC